MAYTKENRIFSDALSDTYEIVDEFNVHYSMTEYYTKGITNQAYVNLFEKKYLSLYRSLWTLKDLSLKHIPRIVHIEDSNGILVVWESFYGMSLKEYIELYSNRVPYKAILNVMSSLLDDCETAHLNGLYFAVSPDTIYLTDNGVLSLNAMVNPSLNIYSTIICIAQSIFFMLTGYFYGNLQVPVDVYIPSPLRELLNDTLTGRREFTGIGEFHNALRRAVRDAESEDNANEKAIHSKRRMYSAIIAAVSLGIGCFSILILALKLFIL